MFSRPLAGLPQALVLLRNDGALPLRPPLPRVGGGGGGGGLRLAVVGPQGVTKLGLFSDYAGDDRDMQTCGRRAGSVVVSVARPAARMWRTR